MKNRKLIGIICAAALSIAAVAAAVELTATINYTYANGQARLQDNITALIGVTGTPSSAGIIILTNADMTIPMGSVSSDPVVILQMLQTDTWSVAYIGSNSATYFLVLYTNDVAYFRMHGNSLHGQSSNGNVALKFTILPR